MQRIKNLWFKLLATLLVVLFAACMYFFSIPCVWLKLTGIPCLGCGMTRALICALSFSFKEAFSYHIMFWSVPVLYVSFLLDGKLFKNKWLNIAIHIFLCMGFVVNWLLQFFG